MAKADALSNADPYQEGPSRAATAPDPHSCQVSGSPAIVLGEFTVKETQDPPTAQENQGQDYVCPTEVIPLDGANPSIDAGVSRVGEVQAVAGAQVVEGVDGTGQEEQAGPKQQDA